MDRRTGKTTRVVDDAIQKLFEYGHITVPIDKNFINYPTNDTFVYELVDMFCENQTNIINIIQNRLISEHKIKLIEKQNNVYSLPKNYKK